MADDPVEVDDQPLDLRIPRQDLLGLVVDRHHRVAIGGSHLTSDTGQQAVDEAARPVGTEPDGQVDRLGEDHPRRHVVADDQLGRAHPQRRSVEGGHPGDRPAFGEPPEQIVDPVTVRVDGLHERRREVVRRDRELGQDLSPGGSLGFGFVEQAERSFPSRPPLGGEGHQALVMYSPERVSTLMRSPGFTKSGTWTTRPVSRVAGLRAPDTRSPCTPGSVSVTSSSTAAGRSEPTISSPYICSTTVDPSTM